MSGDDLLWSAFEAFVVHKAANTLKKKKKGKKKPCDVKVSCNLVKGSFVIRRQPTTDIQKMLGCVRKRNSMLCKQTVFASVFYVVFSAPVGIILHAVLFLEV